MIPPRTVYPEGLPEVLDVDALIERNAWLTTALSVTRDILHAPEVECGLSGLQQAALARVDAGWERLGADGTPVVSHGH